MVRTDRGVIEEMELKSCIVCGVAILYLLGFKITSHQSRPVHLSMERRVGLTFSTVPFTHFFAAVSDDDCSKLKQIKSKYIILIPELL